MLVHDVVRGGATLDVIRNEECPQELRDAIFRNRRIIEWHRVRDFQLVGLKLIAEQLLLGCPVYQDEPSLALFVPGEIAAQRIAFRNPVVLYASPNNPGAGMIALWLAGATKRLTIVSQPAPADGDGKPPEATHFLLYLTSQTFVGPKGEALAGEIRRVRRLVGVKIVMLHENDFTNDGCEFGRCMQWSCLESSLLFSVRACRSNNVPPVCRFFETTPHDLISDGLYEALALASFPGAFWPVSVALVARALGATPAPASDRSAFTPGAASQSIATEDGREMQPSAPSSEFSKGAGQSGSSHQPLGGAGPSVPSDPEMGRPVKALKREKSAMFGWGADEEHSIARPPRLSGPDSWTDEGGVRRSRRLAAWKGQDGGD